jgi:type VI secretion system protein ImpA
LSVLDVDQLLAPISDDAPSGENLEYEPEFGELERSAQGTDEHVMGDEVVEAQEPDWREVKKQAEELLGKTKDLRVGVLLTRAALNIHGPEGLADGTAVLRGMVERYWDTVHPQLDAEDDDDPTFRVNSVLPLSDAGGVLRDISRMILVSSKAAGRFSLRDIRVAKGEREPAGDQETVPDSALIAAAFMDSDVEELQANAAHTDAAIENVGKIEAVFAENIGAANSPDVGRLTAELKELQKIYSENLAARGIGSATAEADASPTVGGGGSAPISGEVNTREDAIRMIDKICMYYERNEPSSPVPLLLQRAKRLVSKDFMEILRDLTPDGVSQAENVTGTKSEGDGGDGW